mgnify:CR=1 FL=1
MATIVDVAEYAGVSVSNSVKDDEQPGCCQ